jgi:hypothetical protein
LTRNSDFESTIEEIEKQYGIGPYARKQQQEEEMVVESYNRQKPLRNCFMKKSKNGYFMILVGTGETCLGTTARDASTGYAWLGVSIISQISTSRCVLN